MVCDNACLQLFDGETLKKSYSLNEIMKKIDQPPITQTEILDLSRKIILSSISLTNLVL